MGYASLLNGQPKFLHQYIYDGVLQTCRDVFLVMLDKVWVFGHPLSHIIKERGFQSRETIVESRDVWF